MPITFNATSGITFNDGSTQNTRPAVGFRNRIINGDMRIDQRNAGASVTPTAVVYTLDRWLASISQSSKISIQRSSVVPSGQGYTNSLLVTSLASTSLGASDAYYIVQNIEGFNTSDLDFGSSGSQSVTISFWARSSVTGTFVVVLRSGAPDYSYPATYTINSANTWERKTVTISGATSGTWASDNTLWGGLFFGLGAGSVFNATANTWGGGNAISVAGSASVVGTNGATFYITGVQLEAGSTATDFERRPIGTELALCQRYCYVATSEFVGVSINNTTVGGAFYAPVTMRASPTFSGGSFAVSSGSAGTFGAINITARSAQLYNTATNWSTAANVNVTATASSEL